MEIPSQEATIQWAAIQPDFYRPEPVASQEATIQWDRAPVASQEATIQWDRAPVAIQSNYDQAKPEQKMLAPKRADTPPPETFKSLHPQAWRNLSKDSIQNIVDIDSLDALQFLTISDNNNQKKGSEYFPTEIKTSDDSPSYVQAWQGYLGRGAGGIVLKYTQRGPPYNSIAVKCFHSFPKTTKKKECVDTGSYFPDAAEMKTPHCENLVYQRCITPDGIATPERWVAFVIVLQLMDGSLYELLRNYTLTQELKKTIITEVQETLICLAMHSRIYTDIKAENVLFKFKDFIEPSTLVESSEEEGKGLRPCQTIVGREDMALIKLGDLGSICEIGSDVPITITFHFSDYNPECTLQTMASHFGVFVLQVYNWPLLYELIDNNKLITPRELMPKDIEELDVALLNKFLNAYKTPIKLDDFSKSLI